MSQNDLVIANQNFPATRADINSALQALGSTNSGATEPATTYASMLWHDTTAEVLKIRAEANDAWITLGYLNQSTDTFSLLDDTQTVSTLGVQTGLLGDQATTTLEGGTGTLQSLVSPANVKAAIIALYSEVSAPNFTTQTNFNSGVTTAAHGLGAVPSRWEVKIVCTSSNLGYAVGDVISLTSHNEGGGARGNTASVNATNIQIAGNSVYVVPKAGGGVAFITNSSWDVILECWK